jgi:hypothetical protein
LGLHADQLLEWIDHYLLKSEIRARSPALSELIKE